MPMSISQPHISLFSYFTRISSLVLISLCGTCLVVRHVKPEWIPKKPDWLSKGPNWLPKKPNWLSKGPNWLPKKPNWLSKSPTIPERKIQPYPQLNATAPAYTSIL